MIDKTITHLITSGKNAFTLAEVLITLGIIGVVAAMTIPTLIADYQERSFNTSATVFERKLGEALKVMNSQMTLAGHESTESFVDELSKHFKITKVCDNDELMSCFEEEVFWGSGTATPETVDMNAIRTSKHFGQSTWQQTNIVGVQFANGTTALIAYNKDTAQDPYSNQIINITDSSNGKSRSVSLGTTALAILYDTNGAKSPNQSAKDLRSINVTKLGSGCFAEANGVCIAMKPFTPTPVTKTECEQLKANGYGINACYYDNDYWAGAVKACGGTSKMASPAQLAEIANYVYNTSGVGAEQNKLNLSLNSTKATDLGLPSSSFYLWSNKEDTGEVTFGRDFDSTYSGWVPNLRHFNYLLAVCIGD